MRGKKVTDIFRIWKPVPDFIDFNLAKNTPTWKELKAHDFYLEVGWNPRLHLWEVYRENPRASGQYVLITRAQDLTHKVYETVAGSDLHKKTVEQIEKEIDAHNAAKLRHADKVFADKINEKGDEAWVKHRENRDFHSFFVERRSA